MLCLQIDQYLLYSLRTQFKQWKYCLKELVLFLKMSIAEDNCFCLSIIFLHHIYKDVYQWAAREIDYLYLPSMSLSQFLYFLFVSSTYNNRRIKHWFRIDFCQELSPCLHSKVPPTQCHTYKIYTLNIFKHFMQFRDWAVFIMNNSFNMWLVHHVINMPNVIVSK